MLNLHIYGIDTQSNIIVTEDGFKKTLTHTDIDPLFFRCQMDDKETISNLINEIEGAKYIDKQTFEDRFGVRQYWENISTGSKLAIAVCCLPDILIDISEAGYNARDAILRYIKRGKVVMPYTGMTVSYDIDDASTQEVDIEHRGFRFTSLKALNHYLEYWDVEGDPEDGDDGVEIVSNNHPIIVDRDL